MAEWAGNDLYFAIRCDERPGEKLNIATKKDGDQAIWYGDVVEIQLATDAHSYYQLAISPAGALLDFDRGAPKNQWASWSSSAEVATQIADDHWTAEVRIPITQDANDPLNQVIGHKPTKSLPWHINVCRQRVREGATEHSAFSPTGTSGFHFPMKFAHFYAGNSHKFDADPSVTDYIFASRAAETLSRARKWQRALASWIELADSEQATEFQRSSALAQAAECALNLKDYSRAGELAGQIPIVSVAKTTRMNNLAAQRKWGEVIDEYAGEDLAGWPFWQIGRGAFARGKGFYFTKNGEQAETDLQLALCYEPDARTRLAIRTMMAHNRETNLADSDGALSLYQQNHDGKQRIGAADEFRSVDRAASILAEQGKFREALETYDVVNFETLKGFWLHEMLISKADGLLAAGRKNEAKELLHRVINDDSASTAHRKQAADALQDE